MAMKRWSKKNVIRLGVTIGSLLLLLFIVSRFGHVITGPRIIIDNAPKETLTVPSLTLSGKIKGGKLLWINGSQVPVNQKGIFIAELVVPPGYTIMTLEAQDELGARRRKMIPIYYLPSEEPAPIETTPDATEESITNEQL